MPHVLDLGSRKSLPGASRPSVHVAVPLESGNVQVSLRRAVRLHYKLERAA